MATFLSVVNDHLYFDIYDGAPRTAQQTVVSTGSLVGETKKDSNKVKVLYGLLKEPELNIPFEDEEETEDEKESRRDISSLRKSKNDPNAPSLTRIPLPELRDIDKQEKVLIFKDSMKRANLGPNSPPSICFYTFLNSFAGVCSCAFTDDSSMLAAGFENSQIKVWTLSNHKLRSMKSGDILTELDKESDDILERMMDSSTASDSKNLIGHSGPVYAVCFSHDRHYILSSSEDGTVRL
ncbi:TAF5 [Bugula neritina]|uniref:TAF5 n=1 Tax=Bugula neritina TaxID=10212 RepID=A0A7J7JFL0_BUGNE|nr:TAF5 [Bugula neritina]